MSAVKLGTRGSALALAQADLVTAALEAAIGGISVERHIIKTTGDARPDLKLSEFSQGENPILDKGIFTKELEVALAGCEIDLAVHSLKDVPTELDDQFKIAATLERAPIEDLIIFADPSHSSLDDLPRGATVATSSVRRKRLLLHQRPDLNVIDIRGNVPTRLRKVAERHEGAEATLLAKAGLLRLGLLKGETLSYEGQPLSHQQLDPKTFPPAAGQGAVAIEIRALDETTAAAVSAINHIETYQRVTAERSLLRLLAAGCQTPIGIHTSIDAQDQLQMEAIVFQEQNETAPPKTGSAKGDANQPAKIAQTLLENLS